MFIDNLFYKMKKLIIKKNSNKLNFKNKKKPIPKKKKKLNKKKVKSLEEEYLDFDLDIDEEFKKTIKTTLDHGVNMQLINELPALNSDKIVDKNPKKLKLKIKKKITKPREDSIDIDIESLDKQTIGNKSYYMDYDKGIIYDNLLNSVGNIGEFGEINI